MDMNNPFKNVKVFVVEVSFGFYDEHTAFNVYAGADYNEAHKLADEWSRSEHHDNVAAVLQHWLNGKCVKEEEFYS